MNLAHSSAICLALSAACLSAGCFTCHVGRPESYTAVVGEEVRTGDLKSSDVLAATPFLRNVNDTCVSVSLVADIEDEYALVRVPMSRTVEKQRRMTFGLFPNVGAKLAPLQKPGFSRIGVDWNTPVPDNRAALLLLPVTIPIGTVWSLLVKPFYGDYGPEYLMFNYDEYQKDFRYDAEKGKKVYDPNGREWWTDFRTIREASGEKLNIWLLGEEAVHPNPQYAVLFTSWFGFARGCEVYLSDRQDGTPVPEGTRRQKRSGVALTGPFEVELSIKELRWRVCKTVEQGQTQAVFALPEVAADATAEVNVSIRSIPGRPPPDITDKAIAMLGKTGTRIDSFYVALKAPPKNKENTGTSGTAATQQKTQHPARPLYESIRKKDLSNGRIEVRVRVNDTSRTFDIDRMLQSAVRQVFRDDFAGSHPGESDASIREYVHWVTSKDGREMIYTGWAFSVRPLRNGWYYNNETRRGWVRLRISENIPVDEAKSWAQENISAIVSDKNIALEVGKAPPPGATYRSLDESFEDGILTVEFEAVQ